MELSFIIFKESYIKHTDFYSIIFPPIECSGGEHIGETTIIVDDMVCRYCKNMVIKLITSLNGVSRVNVNTSDRTINVAYDSQVTDAYVIQMALLKAGYKTLTEPRNAF
jgi:copper chaperone CopZ